MTHPKTVFWFAGLLVFLLGLQIPSIKVDTDPENMLSADQPDRVIHNQIKTTFGLWDMLVVGYVNDAPEGVFSPSSLRAVDQVTDFILSIDGVIEKDLLALGTVDNITQEGPGSIRFQWMMDKVPSSVEDAMFIRESVANLPMLHNTLVSEDGKASAIYVPIKEKHESYRISQEIKDYIARHFPEEQFHITGLPVAEDTFGVEMFIQMAISAPAAAVAIFLLMLVFFRSALLVTAPMVMAMIVVISTMGLLIGMGYTVHIMSSMIPIFLMPIAVVDSVHILSEFADRYRHGDDPKMVLDKVMQALFQPMLFTSITSAIGFASLALTPIPPVQVFGLFVAFGILLAFLMTITFIPAYVVSLKPEALEKMAASVTASEKHGKLAFALSWMGSLTVNRQKVLLVIFAGIVGMSVWGIQKIQINDNPVRWFQEDHEIRVADRVLNDHFAGTYEVFIALENDQSKNEWQSFYHQFDKAIDESEIQELKPWWKAKQAGVDDFSAVHDPLGDMINIIEDALFELSDQEAIIFLEEYSQLARDAKTRAQYFQTPAALTYISELQQYLQATGYIGKSNSLSDLVKTVYRELTADQNNYVIPGSQGAIAQTLLSYQGSHRPQDLWHFVTPDYSSSVIWLQLSSGDNQDMEKVLDAVDAYLLENPLPKDVSLKWGGLTYINVVWQEAMVSGMLDSLLGSFVAVFVVMVLLFRSFLFGLLAMIPLTVTIGFIYGLIGIIGKDYDMPIAVLSSLTLGLSVDFAIHFLERYRSTFKRVKDWKLAVGEMFDEPARAISRNALVISLGFTPLLLAPLVPYNTVGVFLATIMAVSCAVTLLLLPVLLKLLNRWLFSDQKMEG